jgi:GntR family transcriptional regulator
MQQRRKPRPRLERQDGIPLYVTLQEHIERLISGEGLRPGDILPSEATLQARFGVSRATVRQALATLERRGLVERQQGRGTFVSLPVMERRLPELTGFSEHVRGQGMRPSSRLIDYTTLSATTADDTRHFPVGTQLVRVVRLRYANDVVVGLHTVYVPFTLAQHAGFSPEALSQDRSISLYALLEAAGIGLAWAEEHLQARGATPTEAALLSVTTGTPVMSVLRLTRDTSDQLVEVVRAIYLGDKYDYIVHLDRHSGDAARGGIIKPDRKEGGHT